MTADEQAQRRDRVGARLGEALGVGEQQAGVVGEDLPQQLLLGADVVVQRAALDVGPGADLGDAVPWKPRSANSSSAAARMRSRVSAAPRSAAGGRPRRRTGATGSPARATLIVPPLHPATWASRREMFRSVH